MSSFDQRCYALLKKVPKGKVTTYQDLAHALKSKAYRAVGNAMNKNPYSYSAWGWVGGHIPAEKPDKLVPCHRVVKTNGSVGGFAHGTKKKISMLIKEGIKINEGKINLEKYGHKFK